MFLTGVIFGAVLIGAPAGFLVAALCHAAAHGDRQRGGDA
jgi:hypothetical protein